MEKTVQTFKSSDISTLLPLFLHIGSTEQHRRDIMGSTVVFSLPSLLDIAKQWLTVHIPGVQAVRAGEAPAPRVSMLCAGPS